MSASRVQSSSGKSLLIETPAFDRGPDGQPMTSYLRMGAAAAEHVCDRATMRSRTPEGGAWSCRAGAGEDLAALAFTATDDAPDGDHAHAFLDDSRDRCDPPERDREVDDGVDARAELIDSKRELDHAEARLQTLGAVLRGVLADPHGWLADLRDEWARSAARTAELEAAYEEAIDTPPAEGDPARDPRYCPNFTPRSVRRAESDRLHGKGGWRDHTDGNRIVTTQGDKVEVVRGNYRLVVLGRHEHPCDPAGHLILPGWDASGGHINEETVTVAQETNIGWKRRQNGTWHAFETTYKNDTKLVSTGDSESRSFGHYAITTTGSESPSGPWHAPEHCPGSCHVNPTIESTVCAKEMRSFTGSATLPVPHVRDETWAVDMVSATSADRITDTTHVDGSMSSSAVVLGLIEDKTTATTFDTTTETGAMVDIKTSAVSTEITLGDTTDRTTGTTTSLATWRSVDIFAGLRLSLSLAANVNVSLGISSDAHIGVKADLSYCGYTYSRHFGLVSESSVGLSLAVALMDLALAPMRTIRGASIQC